MKLKPLPYEFSLTRIDSMRYSVLEITMTDDCYARITENLMDRMEVPLQLLLSWEIALALREQTGYADEIIIT